MKIELERYEEVIVRFMRKRDFKNPEALAKGLIIEMRSFLHCSKCDEVLPSDHFYKATGFPARGNKYPFCKTCIRRERAGEDLKAPKSEPEAQVQPPPSPLKKKRSTSPKRKGPILASLLDDNGGENA